MARLLSLVSLAASGLLANTLTLSADDAAAATAAAVATQISLKRVAPCGLGCKLHILNETVKTHNAGCLDGSPPGFYFRPGRGADKSNFILWSHGGGWCRSEGECAGRAMTYEGSSTRNSPLGPPRQNMNTGIMSSNCAHNPKFCNWTVVYFIYCDGGSWTGDRDQPVPTSQAEYADPPVSEVHFKGKRNLQAIMDTLISGPAFGLGSAAKVIYAGASAGGLTTYLHCDAVAAMLPASNVRCLGDAGFFLDHPSVTGASPYRRDMKYLFNMMNSSGGVNQECLNSKASDLQWMCIFADYTLPHIRTPFFISNSRFDSWQMEAILGGQAYYGLNKTEQAAYTKCSAHYSSCEPRFKAIMDEWAVAFKGKLGPAISNRKDGLFVNNCHRHHNVDGEQAFMTKINNKSLIDAVAAWAIEGKLPKFVDTAVPGQNPSC